MIRRILALGVLGMAVAMAQQPAAPAPDPNYKPPMTSWGEPDLQGMWPINHLIAVPLQRPKQYGNRLYLTDEEFAGVEERLEARNARLGGPIPVADKPDRAMRQTSLIVFPEDGQFPELTAYGKELQAKERSTYNPGQVIFDAIEDFSAWDRCITRGMPVSMLPRNYNNGIRIVQSPGYVAIVVEMAHETRIIPTNGAPPLDSQIKQWLGESRGHWEGNTLVVETTNYNGLASLTSAGVPGSPGPLQPSSKDMKTIERFTRVGPERIDYELVLEAPDILAPGYMKIQYPMFLDNDYGMYEYACHEGNTAVRNYIEASRFERGLTKGK